MSINRRMLFKQWNPASQSKQVAVVEHRITVKISNYVHVTNEVNSQKHNAEHKTKTMEKYRQ